MKYRGQLTPKNKDVECEVHLKKVEKGAGKATVIADGYLVVDLLRVYEVTDMRLDIVSQTLLGRGGQGEGREEGIAAGERSPGVLGWTP